MKKIVFYGVIALAVMGCGGGSGLPEDYEQKVTLEQSTNPNNDRSEEGSKDSESATMPSKNQEPIVEKAPDASNPYPAPYISEETISLYLDIINAARAEGQDCGKLDSHGVPVISEDGHYIYDGSNIMPPAKALKWSDALYKAAYEHSSDLVQSNTASHRGSGTDSDWTGMDMGGRKSTFVDRARNNGYAFTRLGENISMGTHRDTIQKAVDSWLKSPGHCVNLMQPYYTEVGVAHIEKRGTTYTHYWTQEFGTPIK